MPMQCPCSTHAVPMECPHMYGCWIPQCPGTHNAHQGLPFDFRVKDVRRRLQPRVDRIRRDKAHVNGAEEILKDELHPL